VWGRSVSTSGIGLRGTATATTGSTVGISASVASPAGTAGVFNNAAGGKILTGQNNGVEKFSVDGSGNVNALGRFTGSGEGLTGIQFSQLGGTLASSQFGGTYSNAVTLSNTSNVYYGNGSNLTGVAPTQGSPYYIQNGTSQQSSSNFNISGSGTLGGTLLAGTVNTGTTYQISGNTVLSTAGSSNLFLGQGAGSQNTGILNLFAGAFAGFRNTAGNVNTFSSYQAGYSNTSGNANTFYGASAGQSNTLGGDNTFSGEEAGTSNTTGSNNTFTGYQAGFSNIDGNSNTSSGWRAGYSNTHGGANTFEGAYSGNQNTTGDNNTFAGYQAGYSNTNGYSNAFFGTQAGSQNVAGWGNTFSGYQTGYFNNQGINNTFSGYQAGFNTNNCCNTFSGYQAGFTNTGHDNTFLGWESGFSTSSGAGNIFIGSDAGYSNTTGSNNVYIANVGSASGVESNAIRIGSTSSTAAYIGGIYGINVGGVDVQISSDGQLGAQTSSRRFKEQIADMGDSSSRLFQLRPVTFFYKPQYDDGSHLLQYGLIAEEVAKVYPELVAYDKDGQPYTVKYQYLAPMLLNEVQKQHTVVAAQQDVIKTQQQQIENLQQQNEEFQQRLVRLESLVPRQ
jgi:hypothetical protein